MGIEVTFRSRRSLAQEAVENAAEKALEECGLAAEGYAVRNLRNNGSIRTGRLWQSITHEVEGDTCYVGTNVYYAPYVEYGTRRSRAKPFLKPAIADHESRYQAIISAALKSETEILR